MLHKLVDQGYLTIKGKIGENVLPSMAALRWQDPKLNAREAVEMRTGDFLNIPAHQKHRVEWTAPNERTIWLAIHYA
jgi:hypothetical protein